MNLDEQLTVIPMTACALARATTPFVTFEQPFKERVGRLERQLEVMTRYTATIVIGDTWPDSFHDPMSWARMRKVYESYTRPQERWMSCVWPETAIYATSIARLLGVNEQVKYRPHVWTFSQFFEKCNPRRDEDIDILPEGTIYIDDRMIYPLVYPKLCLQPETCELTVIVFGRCVDIVNVRLPKDTEVIEVPDGPSGLAFNGAVEQAHGRFVAVCQAGDSVVPDRFELQLKAAADLSLSPVDTGGACPAWSIRGYTRRADVPTNQLSTLMFRRAIFEQIEGAHPDLVAGFDYDLYVRIISDHRFHVAYHANTLVKRAQTLPFGMIYTQQVYNDAVNRIRYAKDYHALSIRARQLDERLLAAAGPAHIETV